MRKYFFFSVFTIIAVSFIAYGVFTSPKRANITVDFPVNIMVNQEVTAPVLIETTDEAMNAAEVYLEYDPNKLTVTRVSKDNSIFQLWVTDEPKFDQVKGEISFAGGLPRPGFVGSGQIGTITLIAKQPGRHTVTFSEKTRILKNDGLGTAVLLRLRPIIIGAQ